MAQEEYEPQVHFGSELTAQRRTRDIDLMQSNDRTGSYLLYLDGSKLYFKNSNYNRQSKLFEGVIKFDSTSQYHAAYY